MKWLFGDFGQGTGSVGSTTYSKNKYGFHRKTKPIPTQPNSAKQMEVRSYMQQGVASWANLTEDQVSKWNHAADLHFRSRLGQTYSLSGQNLYNALYIAFKKNSSSPLSEPTVFLGSPAVSLPTVSDDVNGKKEITAFAGLSSNDRLIVKSSSTVPLSTSYRNNAFKEYVTLVDGFSGNQAIGTDYPGSGESYRLFVAYTVYDSRGAISGEIEGFYTGTMV